MRPAAREDPMTLTAWIFVTGLSVPMAAGGLLLWLRRVPRGRLGSRTSATLESDEVWYPVNAIVGRDLLVGSVARSSHLARPDALVDRDAQDGGHPEVHREAL